jgi:hypothetical protein
MNMEVNDMDVFVVFQSHTWYDADCHTEWGIYGVYSSEEKANEVISSLEKEQENLFNSLSDWEKEHEYEHAEYRLERHSVQ